MPVVARGFLRLEMLLSMEALWQREGQENARGGLRSLLAGWLRELSASWGWGRYVAAVPEERARLRRRGLYSDTARLVSKVAMLRIAVVYAAVLTRTLPKPGDGLR